MPAYRLWPSSGGDVLVDEGSLFEFGMEFTLNKDAPLTGIWHYSPAGALALPTGCRIWDVTSQTIVAGTDNTTPSWSGAAGSGWVKCAYDGSLTLTAGTKYLVSWTSQYVAKTGNYWTGSGGTGTAAAGAWGVKTGIIAALSNTNATNGQDCFGNPGSYPSTGTGSNYWIDVEVTAPGPPLIFAPVGIWQFIEPASGDTTLITEKVGDIVPVIVMTTPASVWCTGITGGGCTWEQISPVVQGTTHDWAAVAFVGTVVTPGTATCTPSYNGTYNAVHSRFQEFSVAGDKWALENRASFENAGSADWPSLNASIGGELYYGYAISGSATVGTQPSFTYVIDGDANALAWDSYAGPGAVQAVLGDTAEQFGLTILLKVPSNSGLLMAMFP